MISIAPSTFLAANHRVLLAGTLWLAANQKAECSPCIDADAHAADETMTLGATQRRDKLAEDCCHAGMGNGSGGWFDSPAADRYLRSKPVRRSSFY